MQPINDTQKLNHFPVLFHLGFRIFFLSGALFSVIALTLWGTFFFHGIPLKPIGNSFWWHSHEMVFGFSGAVIAGFLLTAVQNWTGIPAISGKKLIALFLVWLSARLLILFPMTIPVWIISVIDLSFLPLVTFTLAIPIIKIKQWKNLIFIPILFILVIENTLSHLGLWLNSPLLSQNAIWSAVFTIILLISVMGGRVIPFFTARGTNSEQPLAIPKLELAANLPIVLFVLYFISAKPDAISVLHLSILSATTAILQLTRMLRWQFWLCTKEPLLWSLHLSYLFIPIGFILLTLHYSGFAVSASHALHSFTVGAIGGMILAMIARVSLGHTGRKLNTLGGMRIAFILMAVAALFRSLLSAFELVTPTIGLTVSFVCFITAYSIFLIRYIPILSNKRVDGRTG